MVASVERPVQTPSPPSVKPANTCFCAVVQCWLVHGGTGWYSAQNLKPAGVLAMG